MQELTLPHVFDRTKVMMAEEPLVGLGLDH